LSYGVHAFVSSRGGKLLLASVFDLSTNLPLIVGGIALGSIYGIVALGFVLVFKSTGILNLAQGDFLMLGAYMSVTMLVTNDLGIFLALPLVALSMGLIGLVIHYSVMRRLVGRPFLSIVLVTIGIGMIIRALILMSYGPIEKGRLNALPSGSFQIGEARILWASVVIVAIVGTILLCFMLFFRFTRMGLHIRAVADDLEAAAAQGIRPDTVYAMTWGVSLALAGVAGMLFGNVNNVTPQASTIGLAAMPAAVIGGLSSLGGAVVGGLIVGVVEILIGFHLGQEWRQPAAYFLLFVMLLVKPTGLFGKKDLDRV
jgi:branched-chain amino acid transport system permease protein